MLESALWIWSSAALFALFHSMTASLACKQQAYAWGLKEPRYRLLYSLISTILTIVWALWIHQLPDTPLYSTDGILRGILIAIQLLGALIALAAFQPIDGMAFLGFRKLQISEDPFIELGIYRYMRHPMYSGTMLILFAMPVQSWNGLQFAVVIGVYFLVGSRFEERRMLRQHAEYADYQRRVPAFRPHIRTIF